MKIIKFYFSQKCVLHISSDFASGLHKYFEDHANVLKTTYVLPIIRLESVIPSLKGIFKVCAIASNLSFGLQKKFEYQFFTHNVLQILCLERAAGRRLMMRLKVTGLGLDSIQVKLRPLAR